MAKKNHPKMIKKSFLLYCDQYEMIMKLTDEQTGKLLKIIYKYCREETEQKIQDPLIDIVFTSIKTSIDRDNEKYLKIVERNRSNGLRGGRPKKPKKPSGLSGNPKNPSEPDSDSDSDSDKEKDNADSVESGLFYKTKSGKKLEGKRLESFSIFWDTFDFKKGKSSAANEWLKINPLTNRILNEILSAAKIEANLRHEILERNGTPKWAQGWLSERRWEDEIYQTPVNGTKKRIEKTSEQVEQEIKDALS